MLKRSLALFLAFVMVFSLLPLNALAEEVAIEDAPVAEAAEAVETTQAAETPAETEDIPEPVPETTEAAEPETTPETTSVTETVPATVPETTEATVPETTEETVPETTEAVEDAAGTYKTIEVDNSQLVQLVPNTPVTYQFTVPENGNYIFWTRDGSYPEICISENGTELGRGWRRYSFAAKKDTDYTVTLNCGDQYMDFTLCLFHAEPVDDIWMSEPEVTIAVGQRRGIALETPKEWADRTNVQWWVDDSGILEIPNEPGNGNRQNDCNFVGLKAGTTTLNASLTDANGTHTASLTVHVQDAAALTLGQPTTVHSDCDEEKLFSFTPTKSGLYIVRETNKNWTHLRLKGSGIDADDHIRIQAPMEANETYLISAKHWNYPSDDITLIVEEPTESTGVSFLQGDQEGFVGDEILASLDYAPANGACRDMEYTMEGTGKAVIRDDWNGGVWLRLTQPGTFTLTAYDTENPNFRTSCTITVKELPTWELNETKALRLEPMNGEPCHVFSFTAPESNGYIVWQENRDCSWIDVCDQDGRQIAVQGGGFAQFQVEAGQTYRIAIFSQMDEPFEDNFHLDNLEPTTAIEPKDPYLKEFSAFVGDEYWLSLAFTPGNASRGRIEWTSDSDSVEILDVAETTNEWCCVRMVKPGTATITATHQRVPGVSTSFTIHVGALGTLELNRPAEVTLAGHDSMAAFDFTAPEDATYVIYDQNNQYGFVEIQFHAEGQDNEYYWGDNRAQFTARKGQTYRVIFHHWREEETTYSYILTEAEPAKKITLDRNTLSGFVGKENWLNLNCQPVNADLSGITWTSSNTDVVELEGDNMTNRGIRMKAPGTATVTVQVGSLTATCEVTVLPVGKLEPDKAVSVTLAGHDSMAAFEFTAPEDATYVIYDQTNQYGSVDIQFHAEDQEDEFYWGDNRAQFTARKGQTYQVYFHHWREEEKTYSYILTKAAPATEITLDQNTLSGFAGKTHVLNLNCQPGNADLSGITWTSSNPNVAELEGDNMANRGIRMKAAGRATITVQLGNLTATCKVTVRGVTDISETGTVSFTLNPWEEKGFRFTVSEAGDHTLWNEGDAPYHITLFNSGDYVTDQDYTVHFYNEGANNTYMFEVLNTSDEPQTYKFHVAKSVQATRIFQYFDHMDVCVGEILGLPVLYEPINAIPEDIIWSVEPADYAEIHQSNSDFVYFEVLKAGNFTLKAETKDGRLSSTCTYTATMPEAIGVGAFTETFPAKWVQSYRFTPTESGRYTVWVDSEEWISLMITDPLIKEVIEGGDVMHHYFEKDETYLISVVNLNDHPVDATIHVNEVRHADEVELRFLDMEPDRRPENVNVFVGENFHIELFSYPFYAIRDKVTWTASPAGCAEFLWHDEFDCDVAFKAPGKVTITANLDGKTASYTFNVCEPVDISTGFNETVHLEYADRLGYRFTPPVSATYLFWDQNHNWSDIEVRVEKGETIDFVSNFVQFYAEKGQTYLILPRNINDPHESDFYLKVATQATALTLAETDFTGTVGKILWLDALFTPDNSFRNGLKWSVSDENVIRIRGSYSDRAEILLVGEGTATVTATLGNLKATCKVTVKPSTAIQVGDQVKRLMASEEVIGFTFTPLEDGDYAFYDVDNQNIYMELTNANGDYLTSSNASRLYFNAQAGQTYYILVENYRTTGVKVDLNLKKATNEVGALKLGKVETGYIYPGLYLFPTVYMEPQNATHGELKWEIIEGNDLAELVPDYDPMSDSCSLKIYDDATAGTITLKVTDPLSGLSATQKVEIKSIESMALGKTLEIVQRNQLEFSLVTFTPEASGAYVLNAAVNANEVVGAWVYTEGGSTVIAENVRFTSENSTCTMQLEEGVTYYVETAVYEDGVLNQKSGSYALTILPKVENPTEFLSFSSDHVTLKKGDPATLTVKCQLENFVPSLTFDTVGTGIKITGNTANSVTITAEKAGTYYVTATASMNGSTYIARCRVDVVSNSEIKKAQLGTTSVTSELFQDAYAEFDVLFQNADGSFSGASITKAEFADKDVADLFKLERKNDRTLRIVPTEYAKDNYSDVAAKYSSAVKVTVDGLDEPLTTEALTITVKKTTPKLKAAAVTLNAFYPDQAQPIVVTGAAVTAIDEDVNATLPDWLVLNDDGTVKLNTEAAIPEKGSVTVTLAVSVEGWTVPFQVPVSVKLVTVKPALKLSATSVTFADSENSNGLTLKLLCSSKTDTLASLGVSSIEASGDFLVWNFNKDDGSFVLLPLSRPEAGDITLTVSFNDTDEALELPITVKTQPVKLAAKPSTVTLNSVLGDSAVIPLIFTPADYSIADIDALYPELLTGKGEPADGALDVSYENGAIRIDTNEWTDPGETYKLNISPTEDGKKTTITVKTLAESKSKVTVSAKAVGTLDLSFPDTPVVIKPTFKNYTSKDYTLADWSVTDAEGLFTLLEQNGEYQLWDNGAKPGSYTLNLTFEVGAEYQPSCSVKFNVKETPIRLKLSKTSLTLNKAIAEEASVAVTCLTKGYDFSEAPVVTEDLDTDWNDGVLTVKVDSSTATGTHKLTIQADEKNPAVTLSVKVIDAAVTATLKAKGYIDVIRDSSFVTITPTYKNYAGGAATLTKDATVEYSTDNGKNYTAAEGLFDVEENDDGTYTVRAASYELDTSLKYRVKLTVNGKDFYTALNLKSGTAKVQLTDIAVLYQAIPTDSSTFQFIVADETLNPIADVKIKDKKLAELYDIVNLGGGVFAISFKPGITMPAAKTYNVALDIFFQGNTSAKPNTTATLKLLIK